MNGLKCDTGAVPEIVPSQPVVVQRELSIEDMEENVEGFLSIFFSEEAMKDV